MIKPIFSYGEEAEKPNQEKLKPIIFTLKKLETNNFLYSNFEYLIKLLVHTINDLSYNQISQFMQSVFIDIFYNKGSLNAKRKTFKNRVKN